MCRNITTLRGLDPGATDEEIEVAFEKAVVRVVRATADLLDELPARQQPPLTLPALRRIGRSSTGS